MKKLVWLLALFSTIVLADGNDMLFNQRNADDTGNITRIPAHPITTGVMVYDADILRPGYATLGSGLSISSGVLAVSVPGAVNADWNATSGAAFILNKPTIPAAQVNSDWLAGSGLSMILNKPTLFSGAYSDLTGKPTIPATQVNSDWSSVSGVSQILNKPTLFSGAYADLTGKPTIPAAQVNSDWSAVSGVAQVLNKPTLATVATTGSYNDLSNKPTIPTAVAFDFGTPVTRTLAVNTSYQPTNSGKAAIVTVSPQCTAAITLTTGQTCTLPARVGASNLTCSNGTVVAQWTNGNTGTLTIGLALNQTVGAPGDIKVPIGGYFILCPVSGTFTINNAVDQTAG